MPFKNFCLFSATLGWGWATVYHKRRETWFLSSDRFWITNFLDNA